MKVILRTPHKEEREIQGPLTVREMLTRLDVDPEGVIVARGRELLTQDTLLNDSDTVEIIRAISGGGL